MDLLGVLTSWFQGISFIAEDLGILTEGVHRLREESGLPGMKVLEFAFFRQLRRDLAGQEPPAPVAGAHAGDIDAALAAKATGSGRSPDCRE